MKPTIGRIVHFYSQTVADRNPREPGRGFNGMGLGPYPAMITQVFEDGQGNVTYCNLKVLPPFSPPFDEGSVAEKDTAHYQASRYWEWPPLVLPTPKVGEVTVIPLAAKPVGAHALAWRLEYGAHGVCDPAKRDFEQCDFNDAVTRFAEAVTKFDTDPNVSAAYVHLSRIGEKGAFVHWTKTSDESPTAEGVIVEQKGA